MRLRSAAVLLLLVLQLQQSNAHDKRNQTPEVTSRRHDTSERNSGRRWTTSRSNPYQKIVSSYEREVPIVGETSSEPVETSTSEEEDRAKAKSHKRKQWRTSAPVHDQIPSESSSVLESQKAVSESNEPLSTDSPPVEAQRNQTLRKRNHHRESESTTDPNQSNNKKRRRPNTTTTTTTLAPQTMSDSLYQYFRPLEQDVPQDDIIPFLDFGRKLSPVIPTPSGANSIESKSTFLKHRSRSHHEEKESNSSDEEILQEDMDVTVVKKAIERNSVPRLKLRVRDQGISDYYRKRVPAQVRTTENLVVTSDSSTASSVTGSKSNGVLKKVNRHQTHHTKEQLDDDSKPQKISVEIQNPHPAKAVDIIPVDKKRQLIIRHRSAALKQEHPSPLTAESTLVKTVIKEIPLADEIKQPEPISETMLSEETIKLNSNANISLFQNTNSSDDLQNSNTTVVEYSQFSNMTETKEIKLPKVLSTTVVTSVSVQDIHDLNHETTTEVSVAGTTTRRSATSTGSETLDPLPLVVVTNKSTSISANSTETNPVIEQSTTVLTEISSEDPLYLNNASRDIKSTTAKSDTPLRSRDIYKPKIVTSGISIPHLPRQLPTIGANSTRKPTKIPDSTSPSSTYESTISTTLSTQSPTPLPSTKNKFSPKSTYPTTERFITSAKEESMSLSNVESTSNDRAVSYSTPKSTDYLSSRTLNPKVNISKQVFTEDSIQGKTNHQGVNNGEEIQEVHETAVAEEILPRELETESVPPPKYDETVENLTFVPVESYSPEDQYPIYFTSIPTSTVPVVDTRPETEVAVVQEERNSSTTRPGTEWVVGAVNKDVEVVYPEPLGVGAYILAILGVVPIIIGALIGARFIMNHNRKKVLDESEYSSEYNRSPLAVSPATPLPTKLPRIPTHTHVSWSETEKAAPTISPVVSNGTAPSVRWEFPREKLRLQTLLGQGNFGQVWKAEADDIAGHEGLTRLVAVKTVKESANAREREDLLRELGIMQELGSHPNVVTLLGCCTEKEPIYLLMEYVMYGKLLSFLRDHRTRAHYYNFSDAGDALTSRDLTVFGYCVARGMDYLTNKSIIHRDLAARNVLVDHNKLCKIADFGMSRNVRDTGQIYEQRQSKGALPIRWMAPESLHFSLFTHKTDVWSFGILMWEIVTLGSTPYATMGAREVMRRVRDGYRLDRPSHCRPELFRVIAKCWHSEPSKRPTFADLKVELGQLLSDAEHKGSFVDLDSFADEMRRDSLHRHH